MGDTNTWRQHYECCELPPLTGSKRLEREVGVWISVLRGYSDVQKSMNKIDPIGRLVRGIRRKKRRRYSST